MPYGSFAVGIRRQTVSAMKISANKKKKKKRRKEKKSHQRGVRTKDREREIYTYDRRNKIAREYIKDGFGVSGRLYIPLDSPRDITPLYHDLGDKWGMTHCILVAPDYSDRSYFRDIKITGINYQRS